MADGPDLASPATPRLPGKPSSGQPEILKSRAKRAILFHYYSYPSIEVFEGNASMSLTLPGKPSELTTPDLVGVPKSLIEHVTEPALTTETKEASISSFETPNGSQTLISIESAEASHTYKFPFEAPSGSVSQLEEDGSVSFINDEGEYVGGITKPWAYDANGQQLETSFSLSNGVLTQTVEFDESTAFPVVADPNTVNRPGFCAVFY